MTAPTPEQLLDIYLFGFSSGIRTALHNLDVGMTPEDAEAIGSVLYRAAVLDPAVIETVRDRIAELLSSGGVSERTTITSHSSPHD